MARLAGRPAPRRAERPVERPVERPEPRPAYVPPPAARLAGAPAPQAPPPPAYVPPPAARLAGKPAAGEQAAYRALPAAERPPEAVATVEGRAGPPPPEATATAATAGTTVDTGQGSNYQQEIDILRGQVGTLDIVGLWTSANPPRVTGVWGRLLQGLMAGVSLRDSFANLNHAAAAQRDNNAHILALVSNHKTPMFKLPKGK